MVTTEIIEMIDQAVTNIQPELNVGKVNPIWIKIRIKYTRRK